MLLLRSDPMRTYVDLLKEWSGQWTLKKTLLIIGVVIVNLVFLFVILIYR